MHICAYENGIGLCSLSGSPRVSEVRHTGAQIHSANLIDLAGHVWPPKYSRADNSLQAPALTTIAAAASSKETCFARSLAIRGSSRPHSKTTRVA